MAGHQIGNPLWTMLVPLGTVRSIEKQAQMKLR